MNERLGALLAHVRLPWWKRVLGLGPAPAEGLEVAPLTSEWLDDVADHIQARASAMDGEAEDDDGDTG